MGMVGRPASPPGAVSSTRPGYRRTVMDDPLIIAGKEFRSRLIVGTGKYRTMEEMRDAIDASGAEMVTVAIRRLPLDRPDEQNLMDYLDWDRYTILPNTAGCKTAEEALFTARPARGLTGSDRGEVGGVPGTQDPPP